jgi:hypothetical protein
MKLMEMINEDDWGPTVEEEGFTYTTPSQYHQKVAKNHSFTHKPSNSKFQTQTSVILFTTAHEKFYENCTIYHRSDLNG